MHMQRIAILLIASGGMAGTFFPWLTIFGKPVSDGGRDGWISLGLFAVAAIPALVGNWRRSWRGGGFVSFAIPALLGSAIGIYHVVDLYLKRSAAPGQINLLAGASPGIGLYVVAASGIVLVIAAFALQGPARRQVAQPVSINPTSICQGR
jgi:hypothetical protein